jgi:predicted DNA-binding protein (MmcQ/YjbR family)
MAKRLDLLYLAMATILFLRKLALSFPEVTEEPHFDKTSFRIKKKIFATYNEKENSACLKLSETDQDIFSLSDGGAIYPVSNKWGKQGWTIVELKKIKNDLLKAVLTSAYCEVAPKKLADPFREQ